MRLLERVRARVLWTVVGVLATAVGIIVWSTLPAWPVVGVAVATVVLAINTISSKIKAGSCWGCGESLAGLPEGEHGVVCPRCGSLTQGDRRA